jgi:oxygen-independent coproporphyrinogen-3 oxidase
MPVWNADLIKRYGGQGPRYTSYPTALQFHEEIGRNDYDLAVAAGNQARRPLSLYFHIPFCDKVCYYCACNRVITANRSRAATYLDHLDREMARRAEAVDAQRPVVQLHWGGGTPTYLDDAQITRLMYQTGRLFHLLDNDRGDYAVEIDPRTVNAARLGLLRGLGFNRVSLGIQDLDPEVQMAVNRVQSWESIREVFGAVRDHGFRSTNVDLIYGLPRQSERSLARTMEKIVSLRPERLSLFNYAHLPARFKVQRQIDESTLPSPDEKLRMSIRAGEILDAAGYRYVGMDHFALPEDELARAQDNGQLHRNFQGYTLRGDADLFAFGPSAISQIGSLYIQNQKGLEDWQATLSEGLLPFERGYILDRDDEIRRDLILTLLCDMKLDVAAFEQRWGIDFCEYFPEECRQVRLMAEDGLVSLGDDSFSVTEQGRLFARAVAMVFDRYRSATPAPRFSRIV